MSRYDWMANALCAQVDPELWFPEKGHGYRAAKRICDSCTVRPECNQHASNAEGELSHPFRHGAWAGATPRERASEATKTRKEVETEDRDRRILHLLSAGWSGLEIAEQVGCSTRTVCRVQEASRKSLGEAA